MQNKQASKVILKVGIPIFSIIAGTLLVLKVIGVADVSWWLILGVWLAPFWLVLTLLAALIAFLMVVAVICGLVWVVCWAFGGLLK
jgi:hypothetical protein